MIFQRTFSNSAKALLVYAVFSIGLSACSTSAPMKTSETPYASEAAPIVIDLKKGQLFSVVSVVSKEGDAAKQAVADYYKTAFPLGDKHGLKREGQLLVKAVPVGEHKPQEVVFYSWPNQAAEKRFETEPQWATIKSLRPKAWEELRIYTDALKEDRTLTFHSDKTYTLAMAWSNPKNPDHYDLYMDGIEEAAAEVGGRFVYKMFDPKFESNTIKDGGPSQVTLVEWDTPQGLKNFGSTDGFTANAHYLKTGVTRFEILVLGTQ